MVQTMREKPGMKMMALFLVLVLLSSFFPWQVLAQESLEIPKQAIVVTNEMSEPIEGAVFEIQNQQKEIMETCISDENGRAEIFQVEDGIYQLVQIKTQEGYTVISEQPIEIKTQNPILEETVINGLTMAKPEIIPETQEDVSKTEEPLVTEENKLESEAIIDKASEESIETTAIDSVSLMAMLDSITVKINRDESNPTQIILSTVGYAGKTGIGNVLFPTWSEHNGQDDIRWYQGTLGSNGEFSVTVDIKDHGFETGTYNIHTYAYGEQGETLKIYANTHEQPTPSPSLLVSEVANNSYKITLTGASNAQGVTGVSFPTWSNTGGQDDIRWETGTYVGSDTWEATVNLKDYGQTYDTFSSHAYIIDTTEKMSYITAVEKTIKNQLTEITTVVAQVPGNSTQIAVSTVGCAGKTGIGDVLFPTWSEKNGQDDIQWSQGILGSNGEYSVIIDNQNHGFETGIYNVHTYIYGLRGEVLSFYNNTFNQATLSPSILVSEVANNSYKITLTGASNAHGVAGVSFPTWSNTDGQDDIRWETGTYVGNDTWEATVNLKDYGQTYDTFSSHAYIIDTTGKMSYINAVEKTIKNQLTEITTVVAQVPGNSTQITVSTVGCAGKTGIGNVLFPTWSEKNGQDDIQWSQGILGSNGEYSVIIDNQNHGFETGIYNVHTYIYGLRGEALSFCHNTFNQATPSPSILVSEVANNSYKVTLTGTSNAQGVTGVSFPTWSNTGGQDDIHWETGTYVGNDTWEATVNLNNYNTSYDTFVSHAYVIDKSGKYNYVGSTEKIIVNPFVKMPAEIGGLTDSDSSKFKISTNNCNNQTGIKKISFAVWTNQNGQDDVQWFPGILGTNGEYTALVDIESHGFETGPYIIHAYLYGNGGENIAFANTTYTMEKITPTIEYDKAVLNNTFKIRIKNVGNENGVGSIVFPTWSKTNGQDDIRWEQGTYIGDHTWEANINLRNYNIIVDDFVTHAYLADKNGKMVMAQSSVKTILQNTSTVYGYFNYPLDKGYKSNPSDPTDWFGSRWGSIHEGIDIPAPYYADCYSPGDGVIEKAGYFMGYGRYVRIRMTDRYGESVSFFYGHLQEINVSVGQTVSRGQLVGKVGGSGYNAQGKYVDNAYGPHLHFGAIANADFVCVDPEIWIDFHNPYSNVK